MKWYAVPKTGRVSYCEECGAPIAWIDGPKGRLPIDLRACRGQPGSWSAEPHGPKCTNSERWQGHADQGVGTRKSEAVAETCPPDETVSGAGSLFGEPGLQGEDSTWGL